MTDEPRKDDDDGGAWIETVAKAAGALGFNAVRVRWKLRRWRDRRLAAAEGRRQRLEHIRYEHKVCPKCTAVNDKAADTCSRCGEKLGGRALQLARRAGLVPGGIISASGLLMICIIAVYVRVALAGGGAWIDQPIDWLYAFGGATDDGEWWRAACVMFLHAGLWHILFNLYALSVVGPHVEQEYGRGTMLFAFIVTGLAGSVVSLAFQDGGIRIGASGAIMGLIGIATARGHRDGTAAGRAVRDAMLKWAVYTFIFGLIVRADNWGHGGGLVAGLALGLGIDPRWLRAGAGRRLAQIAGVLGLAATLATTGWIMTQPSPRFTEVMRERLHAGTRIRLRACTLRSEGDIERGGSLLQQLPAEEGPKDLDAQCQRLEVERQACYSLRQRGFTETFGELPRTMSAAERQWTIDWHTERCELILEAR